jgi:hypothetical protein
MLALAPAIANEIEIGPDLRRGWTASCAIVPITGTSGETTPRGIVPPAPAFKRQMRRLLRPLWFAVAVIFLVEEWLWRVLADRLRRAVDALGFPRLRQRLAASIVGLPPAAALLLFLVPGLLLLPLKLLGLSLLARGHWLAALLVLAAAKVAGAGVTAFIFQSTRPQLLRLAWFRWVYERAMRALAWAHGKVDPFKQRVRQWRRTLGAQLAAHWQAWQARPRGRLMRRLLKLRRRAQRPAPPPRRCSG